MITPKYTQPPIKPGQVVHFVSGSKGYRQPPTIVTGTVSHTRCSADGLFKVSLVDWGEFDSATTFYSDFETAALAAQAAFVASEKDAAGQ